MTAVTELAVDVGTENVSAICDTQELKSTLP